MKADVFRISDLAWSMAKPPITAAVILTAQNLPPDAKVIHILPISGHDIWEVLISSDTYPERSVYEIGNGASLALTF